MGRLHVSRLSHISYNVLVDLIWRWKPIGPDLLASTKRMNKYIQRLSVEELKELYKRFLNSARYNFRHYVQAWHIALFIHYGQTELRLGFQNRCFDLQFLLESCGSKLLLLEELEMPSGSCLPASVCQSMCGMLPCLTKLDLRGISLGDDAMPFLATLSLKVLNIEGTDVLDDGLMALCQPRAIARSTLLDLRIEDRSSINVCYELLKSISQLEYLSYNNCKLLTSFSEDMMINTKLNLKKLDCEGPSEQIAKALTIALDVCDDVDSIFISAEVFTPQILHALTKFKNLVTLSLSNHLIVHAYDDLSVYFKNFILCSLRNLFIHRVDVNWFLSGHFLNTLIMCPYLEALTLSYCTGFDDQMASNMVQLLINSKLQRIKLHGCNLIGSKAISDMLSIPSLYELFISMAIPNERSEEFDVPHLKTLANRKNVNLKLSIYCYYRDFVKIKQNYY